MTAKTPTGTDDPTRFDLTLDVTAWRELVLPAAQALERRSTIPVLEHLRISASATEVTASGTNLDHQIDVTKRADPDTPGTILPAGHLLTDILKRLDDGGQARIAWDGGPTVTLQSGRSRFKLPAIDPVDFPVMADDIPAAAWFEMTAADLARMIRRCRAAQSGEEVRYYLNGIHLRTVAGEQETHLAAEATDGHRLVITSMSDPRGETDTPIDAILPRQAVAEIARLIDGPKTVQVAITEARVAIRAGAALYRSKLIDGAFPPTDRVVPDAEKMTAAVTVDAVTLRRAVERVALIATDKSRAVKLIAEDGGLTVAASGEAGRGAEDMVTAEVTGRVEIGVQARYLVEMIEALDAETLTIRTSDAGGPMRITAEPGDGSLGIVMPMRMA